MEKSRTKQTRIALILIAGMLSSSALLLSLCGSQQKTDTVEVAIGKCRFQTEIAASSFSQYKGLSNRRRLPENSGLLFVFPGEAKRTFVMRNMKFPLDIIYIASGKVNEVLGNLPPEGKNYSQEYESRENIDMALEINAGQANRCEIKNGEEIKFIINNHE